MKHDNRIHMELQENNKEYCWSTISEMMIASRDGRIEAKKAIAILYILSFELKSGWAKVNISPETIGIAHDWEQSFVIDQPAFFIEKEWYPFSKKAKKNIAKRLNNIFDVIIFPGFSPIEAYSFKFSQRSDEYSLAAVLYSMLTGVSPPEATDRLLNDTLRPVCEFNKEISQKMSEVIMKALSVKPRKRYKSTKVFVDKLLNTDKEKRK